MKKVINTRKRSKTMSRAYSSCFTHTIVARMRLPFLKNFSNLYIFAEIFKYFALFLAFFWKIARMPYFSRVGPDEWSKASRKI